MSETLDRAMVRSNGLGTLLRDLTDRAVREAPGAVASSSTVRRADRLLTLAGSSGPPSGPDLYRYEYGAGPCAAAAETGAERCVPDLAADDRWPRFARIALAAGVCGVPAVPLRPAEGEPGAALSLYGERAGSPAESRSAAQVFAARAADAIDTVLRVERLGQTAADVRTALLSRSVIDQAIGMLLAHERIAPDRALERLHRASQNRNIKLRDLCGLLVARTAEGASSGRQ
ncbi:GAF and ANTAR domain-containing protein [Streptomyces composti]|nr:GAF and ANTAR domain-containing protein [Streptomyces composti]